MLFKNKKFGLNFWAFGGGGCGGLSRSPKKGGGPWPTGAFWAKGGGGEYYLCLF